MTQEPTKEQEQTQNHQPYTLLYDGACSICTSQAHSIATFDRRENIELLDINSDTARARFPRISPQDAQREIHLAAPDGTLYRGAEAVRQTLLRLPILRGIGILMSLPGAMTVARPVYRWVARNRYRLSGKPEECPDGACSLPTRTSDRHQQ